MFPTNSDSETPNSLPMKGPGNASNQDKVIPSIPPSSIVRRSSATRATPSQQQPRSARPVENGQNDSPTKIQPQQEPFHVITDSLTTILDSTGDTPKLKRSRSMPFESPSPTNSNRVEVIIPSFPVQTTSTGSTTNNTLGGVISHVSMLGRSLLHPVVKPQGLFKSPSPQQTEDKIVKTAISKRQAWAESQLNVPGRSRTGSEIANPSEYTEHRKEGIDHDILLSTPPSRSQQVRPDDSMTALTLEDTSSLDIGANCRVSRSSQRIPGTPVSKVHTSRRAVKKPEQQQVLYDAEEPMTEYNYRRMFDGYSSTDRFSNDYQNCLSPSREFQKNTQKHAKYQCECGQDMFSRWFQPEVPLMQRVDTEQRQFLGSPSTGGLLRSAFQRKKDSLGEGAFGSVYRAMRESDGRILAVKELKPTHEVNSRSLRRQAHALKVQQPTVTRTGQVLTFVDMKHLRAERLRRGICSCGKTGVHCNNVSKPIKRFGNDGSPQSIARSSISHCVEVPSQQPVVFNLQDDVLDQQILRDQPVRSSLFHRIRETHSTTDIPRSRSQNRHGGRLSPQTQRSESPIQDSQFKPGSLPRQQHSSAVPPLDTGQTPLMKSTTLNEYVHPPVFVQPLQSKDFDRDLMWLSTDQPDTRNFDSQVHELHFLKDGSENPSSSVHRPASLHIPVHTNMQPEGRSLAEATQNVALMSNVSKPLLLEPEAYTLPLHAYVKTLTHPHLLRHHSQWVENEDTVYLATSLCDGDLLELGEVLRKRADFTERHVWTVLSQSMRAQMYLHRIGFVHRDMKPQNILYTQNMEPDAAFVEQPTSQEEYRIVLADFGSVEPVDKNLASDNSEEVDGNFLAPEVLNVASVSPGFVERVQTEDLAYRILEQEELQNKQVCRELQWNPVDAAMRQSQAPSHSVIALEYHGRSQKLFSPLFSEKVNLQDSFFKPDGDDMSVGGLLEDSSFSVIAQELDMLDNVSVGSLSNDECCTPPTKRAALSSVNSGGRETPVPSIPYHHHHSNVYATPQQSTHHNHNQNSLSSNNNTSCNNSVYNTPPPAHLQNHSIQSPQDSGEATPTIHSHTSPTLEPSMMLNKSTMSYLQDSAYLKKVANKRGALSKAEANEQQHDILSFYQSKNEIHTLDLCDLSPVFKSQQPPRAQLLIGQGPWSDVFSLAMSLLVFLNGSLLPGMKKMHYYDRSWTTETLPLHPNIFQKHCPPAWRIPFLTLMHKLLPAHPTDAHVRSLDQNSPPLIPGISNELVCLLELLLEPNPQHRLGSPSVLTLCKYIDNIQEK